MTALQYLDLQNNSLSDVPNTIVHLPSECTVNLENAGLSMAVLERLRSACSAEGYSGPRIHFSIREDRSNLARYGSIQEAFSAICNKAGIADTLTFEERYSQLQKSMTAENNKERSLFSWLSRLSYMKDTQREGETGLFKVILSHLDLAESNEEFRSAFFSIIDDAAATCGDRMALSVLHLGIAHKRHSIDKSDLKGLADFIIRGQWMLEQLEHIAREKVPTLYFVDEIEVFLAYPVMLKVRLNLPIDVNEMLYFGCSQVTTQNLNDAENNIKGMLGEPNAVANILVQREDWIKALEGHPEKADEITSIKQQRTRKLEDGEDATEIQSEYESALVALTKEVLEK
jgi:E3 ubiquitin-protein ligase SspH2